MQQNKIITTAALLFIGAVTTPAQTITWDGGGNGTSWSDPLNWSGDVVPGAADDVSISAGPGTNVVFNVGQYGLVTIKSLTCSTPFTVANGTLNINGGASQISGPLSLSGGLLSVETTNASLVISGPVTNLNGSLVASTGGIIHVPGLTAANVQQGNPVLRAIGAGAVLDLSSLTNLSVGDYLVVSLQAFTGGQVNASALSQSSGALYMTANGAESKLDVTALAGPWHGDNGVYYGLYAQAESGGAILIPQVTSMERGTIEIQNGGTITTAQFTNLYDVGISIVNSSITLSNLTSLVLRNSVTWTVNGNGSVLDLSGLTNLTVVGASPRLTMQAQAGGRLDLNALEQINGGVTLKSVNAGSVADLSSLGPRWSGAGISGGVVVQAQGGTILLPRLEVLDQAQLYASSAGDIQVGSLRDIATVNLNADSSILRLTNVTSLVVSNSNPLWQAIGIGGLLDLSHLTSLLVSNGLSLNVQATGGGKVDLSGLTQSAGALWLTANGADSAVDVSGLAGHWRGDEGAYGLYLHAESSGDILIPQITSMDRGTVELANAGTFTSEQFTNLNDVGLNIVNASMTLSNLTSLNLSNNVTWNVSGTGSVLDLSGLTNLIVVGASKQLTMQAQNGALLDLSALQQTAGGVSINTLNAGTVADLSSLGPRWSGAGANGGLTVQAQSGSTMLLPQLEELDQAQFIARSGADIQAGNLRDIAAANVIAADAILRLTNVTSLVVSNYNPLWQAVGVGAVLDLSHLTNLDVISGQYVSVQASSGGRVDLSGLNSLFTGAVQVMTDGADSTVDLSSLSGFVNLYPSPVSSLTAQNGGLVLLPEDALLLANVQVNITGNPILPPITTPFSALTLFGRAWHSYLIESRPLDNPGAAWNLFDRVPMTNAVQELAAVAPAGVEFRVAEFVADPSLLELNPASDQTLQLLIFGVPNKTYQVESTTNLLHNGTWETGETVLMTNSFRFLAPKTIQDARRFIRTRETE